MMRLFGIISVLSVVMLMSVGTASALELSSVDVQTRETSLGDLAADAVRESAGTPLALIPAGSFRETTVSGDPVKAEDVLRAVQYPDDKVAVVELTGDQIVKALDRSVSVYPQKNLGFLQVSGVKFTFDAKSPKGSRIVSVSIDGEKVSGDRKYRVATTQPLADGAYGYFTIWGKDLKVDQTGKTTAQAVRYFLAKHDADDYDELDRINVKGK